MGIYYLTQERPGVTGEGKYFKSVNEAILAYENKACTLHSRIHVRMTKVNAQGEEVSGFVRIHIGTFYLQRNPSSGFGLCGQNGSGKLLKTGS